MKNKIPTKLSSPPKAISPKESSISKCNLNTCQKCWCYECAGLYCDKNNKCRVKKGRYKEYSPSAAMERSTSERGDNCQSDSIYLKYYPINQKYLQHESPSIKRGKKRRKKRRKKRN